jgi:hypothetical protein
MVSLDYLYGQSIVAETGSIETRVHNGAQLNHKGDSITFKGMAPLENESGTYGTILRVTHSYESGNINKMPADYVLELKPDQTARVVNLENDQVNYNVKIRAEGPLYEAGVYKGYQVQEAPPVENGISDEADVVTTKVYGPVMGRLMALPFFQRFMGGRSMSLQKPRSDPFPGYPTTPKPTPRGGPTPTPTPRRVVPRVAPPPTRRHGSGPRRKGGR